MIVIYSCAVCGNNCPPDLKASSSKRSGTKFVPLCSAECRENHSPPVPPPVKPRDVQRAVTRSVETMAAKLNAQGESLGYFTVVSTGEVRATTGKQLQPIVRTNLGRHGAGLVSDAFQVAMLMEAGGSEGIAARLNLSAGALATLIITSRSEAPISNALVARAQRILADAAQTSPVQAASPNMPGLSYSPPPTSTQTPSPQTPPPQLTPMVPEVMNAWTTDAREGEGPWLAIVNQENPEWWGQERQGNACWAIALVSCIWASRYLHEVLCAATNFSAVHTANRISTPVATALSSLCAKDAGVKVGSIFFYQQAKILLKALGYKRHDLSRQQDMMHILALTIQELKAEIRNIKQVPGATAARSAMWDCLSRVSVSVRYSMKRAACAQVCGKTATSTVSIDPDFALFTIKPKDVTVSNDEEGPFGLESVLSNLLHVSLTSTTNSVCSDQRIPNSCALLRHGKSAFTFPELSPLHSVLISVQTTVDIPIQFEIRFQLRLFFLVFITLRSGATQDAGHYTALALRMINGEHKWCHIDDDRVNEVVGNLSQFIKESGSRIVGLTYEREVKEDTSTDEVLFVVDEEIDVAIPAVPVVAAVVAPLPTCGNRGGAAKRPRSPRGGKATTVVKRPRSPRGGKATTVVRVAASVEDGESDSESGFVRKRKQSAKAKRNAKAEKKKKKP